MWLYGGAAVLVTRVGVCLHTSVVCNNEVNERETLAPLKRCLYARRAPTGVRRSDGCVMRALFTTRIEIVWVRGLNRHCRAISTRKSIMNNHHVPHAHRNWSMNEAPAV